MRFSRCCKGGSFGGGVLMCGGGLGVGGVRTGEVGAGVMRGISRGCKGWESAFR